MAAIALVAFSLGAGVQVCRWRNLSLQYQKLAAQCKVWEKAETRKAEVAEEVRIRFRNGFPRSKPPEDAFTPFMRNLDLFKSRARTFARLAAKYERASWLPWINVEEDEHEARMLSDRLMAPVVY
jgi:hypothetical protein